MSGLSDNLNKVHVVHIVFLVTITQRGVDEPTFKTPTPFFLLRKKKYLSFLAFTQVIFQLQKNRKKKG